MQYLSKEENSEAFETYLYCEKVYNENISDTEMVEKFRKFFLSSDTTVKEIAKYQETIDFSIGGSRACYNHDKTVVLRCEMSSPLLLGFTRNLTIVDLKSKTQYNLRYGRGYNTVRNFIKGL